MLDPTQQRVIGVLIEKELAVPESYPLTESILLAGCNQKSNRDPAMEIESSELHGALLALREDGWLARIDGTRATRYRHCLEERLNLRDVAEKAVLAELLLRGPQAPGALKPRVARMGYVSDPAGIHQTLEQLASRVPTALVQELSRRPRERDNRWGHCLGEPVELPATETAPVVPPPSDAPSSSPSTAPTPPPPPATDDLELRVARLEQQMRELLERLGD